MTRHVTLWSDRSRCVYGTAVEKLRIGVVEIEHDDETTNDHLSCSVCSWRLGVSPREFAVRLARRHDASHHDAADEDAPR